MLTENRDFYSIDKTRTKSVGVPRFLEGLLHDGFYKNGANEPGDYAWRLPTCSLPEFGDPLAFPDELWLILKHRRISYDLFMWHEGLHASDRFLSLLDDRQRDYFKIAKMHVVNQRGENIADHPMFYMKQKDPISAVDRSCALFDQDEFQGRKLFERNGQPAIGRVHHMSINPETVGDREIFETCGMTKLKWFVTGALRERMIAAKLKGVDFFHIDEFAALEERWSNMLDPIKGGWAKPL